jgi:hypothetical protein
MDFIRRKASASVSRGNSGLYRSTANSSPSKRATTSTSRTCAWRRRANDLRIRFPTSSPRLSLMESNALISRRRRAKGLPLFICATASLSFLRKYARLGNPVRASWETKYAACNSAFLRSVTSSNVVTQPPSGILRAVMEMICPAVVEKVARMKSTDDGPSEPNVTKPSGS